MTDQLVTLAQYGTLAEAQVAKMRLASEGIEAIILDEFANNKQWVNMSVRLAVARDDAEWAYNVLNQPTVELSEDDVIDVSPDNQPTDEDGYLDKDEEPHGSFPGWLIVGVSLALLAGFLFQYLGIR